MSPKTKRTYIRIARAFFRDLQDWDWIPRRFDPARTLETPRSIRALQGPDPRVIADDLWAKLLWAGLNLDPDDLPTGPGAHPIDMVRAITSPGCSAASAVMKSPDYASAASRWVSRVPGCSVEVACQRSTVCAQPGAVPVIETGPSPYFGAGGGPV